MLKNPLNGNKAIKEPGRNLYWHDASRLMIEGR